MARRVGRFAVGSIAVLDFYGETLDYEVEGRMVAVGVKLTAKRPQIVRAPVPSIIATNLFQADTTSGL